MPGGAPHCFLLHFPALCEAGAREGLSCARRGTQGAAPHAGPNTPAKWPRSPGAPGPPREETRALGRGSQASRLWPVGPQWLQGTWNHHCTRLGRVSLRPRSGLGGSPPGRGGPHTASLPLGPSARARQAQVDGLGVPWALRGRASHVVGVPSLSPQTLLCSQNSWLPGPKIKDTAPCCCCSHAPSEPTPNSPQHSAPSSPAPSCPLLPALCERAACLWNVPWFIIT